jgi:hypothetical protein
VPRLSQLKRDTGTVEIPTGGDEPLIVEYRKAFVSPRLAEQLASAEELAPVGQLAMLADLVRAAVVSWNLTDDEDTPLPLTAEAVATIDAGALNAIARAIQEDAAPDPQNGSISSSTSSRTGDSEPSQTGTPS